MTEALTVLERRLIEAQTLGNKSKKATGTKERVQAQFLGLVEFAASATVSREAPPKKQKHSARAPKVRTSKPLLPGVNKPFRFDGGGKPRTERLGRQTGSAQNAKPKVQLIQKANDQVPTTRTNYAALGAQSFATVLPVGMESHRLAPQTSGNPQQSFENQLNNDWDDESMAAEIDNIYGMPISYDDIVSWPPWELSIDEEDILSSIEETNTATSMFILHE
jgi:hypothetical protein